MDFAIIARARLTQSEFAVLAGVSRVTVNTWVKGAMKPHRFIKARVEQLVKALTIAIDLGYFPLPPEAGKKNKRGEAITATIQAALVQHKQNQAQAVASAA